MRHAGQVWQECYGPPCIACNTAVCCGGYDSHTLKQSGCVPNGLRVQIKHIWLATGLTLAPVDADAARPPLPVGDAVRLRLAGGSILAWMHGSFVLL